MPKIRLTSPVFGGDVGDTPTVTREQAKWAATNGYAVYENAPQMQEKAVDPGVVSYTADDDPTLAANREGPNEGKTPGVDDRTVSEEQSDGSTSGASQDRTGAATGTEDGSRPLANVDASPEEIDALMDADDAPSPADDDATGDGDDDAPPADAGTATPDAAGKPTPKKNANGKSS